MIPSQEVTTLWIGGSSSLARTYVNKYGPQGLLLTGLEPSAPEWAIHAHYEHINLQTLTDNEAKEIPQKYPTITRIIIGVRPLLFAAYTKTKDPEEMVAGIKLLLEAALQEWKIHLVLHISSVAAVDHLRSQCFLSEEDPIPPLKDLIATYDIFKRSCEEKIDGTCSSFKVPVSHLRLSAIFSDDRKCIQCTALSLQSRIGPFLSLAIDCNSAANVASAISVVLAKQPSQVGPVYYYYTRPLSLERPVPYAYYLQTYRRAYAIENASLWIPIWIVTYFVVVFHWIASWNSLFAIPYVDATDYLLQVAGREHSFNNGKFGREFPEIKEENILECFTRRKQYLQRCDTSTDSHVANSGTKKDT